MLGIAQTGALPMCPAEMPPGDAAEFVKQQVEEAFGEMDANSDGTLTATEVL